MTLVKTLSLLQHARDHRYAVGAFNVIGLEHAQAIVEAAESEKAAVILQLSQNSVRHNLDGLEVLGAACRELAERAEVPVAMHLDHATNLELCARAIGAGYGSVMFDGAALPLADNIDATRRVVSLARARGVAVEAELGVVGGKEGLETTQAGKTDVEQARRFVTETGVDALAVALGTTHYMTAKTVSLDLDLLRRLRRELEVPLVLHGASGVADSELTAAVEAGITKVNVATQLNQAFTSVLRQELTVNPDIVDPRKPLAQARSAMVEVVRHYLRLFEQRSPPHQR